MVTEDYPAEQADSDGRPPLSSEELLRLVFENAFDGICIHEEFLDRKQRKLLECNARFVEMTGRTKEELLALEDSNTIVRPVDKMSWVEGVKTKAQGEPYWGLVTFVRPDGKENVAKFTAVPVWVGHRLLTVGVNRDITEQRRAEKELEKERATLDSIVRFNPYAISWFDAEGRFLRCNQALVELFGGSPPADYCLFNDPILQRSGAAAELAKLKEGMIVRSPGPIWYDPREYRADLPGRRVCVRSVCFPICNSDGELEHIVVMFQDVTGHAKTEEALREREALLRATVESLPFDFFAIDADGRYILQNSACREHWGEALGQAPEAMAPTDAVRARWMENNRLAFAGETVTGEVEYTVAGRKGCYHNIIAPIRDGGQVRGILGVNIDITERKLAEAALQESEARYRALCEGAPDATFLADPETGTIVDANPAASRLLGRPRDEIVGLRQAQLHPPHTERQARAVFAEHTHAERQTPPAEMSVLRADGQEVPVEVTARLTQLQGRPVLCGVFRDISERKEAEAERGRLEAQMRHAQKLESLGVLAGGIAHDFNNLLAGILGFADIALHDAGPESPSCDSLERVIACAKQAAELTRQLLAYSGKGRFLSEAVDLSRLIRDTAHLLQVSASTKATLRYQLADDLPAVEADPSQIQQVLMNLVTNASEALGEGAGLITIATGVRQCSAAYLSEAVVSSDLPEGPCVFLEVSDTGCGMDEETRAKVFDPFFSTKFTGRGLGLAAALGIVRGHHGAIRVHTEPGAGSTFTVVFPRSAQPVPPARPSAAPEEPWRGEGTVLVVEDQAAVRTMAAQMLGSLGFDTLTAADGREAVDILRAHADQVVAVLLDVTMPVMSGEETFAALRAARPDVPIILTSGYGEHDVADRFAAGGPAGFIHKPYRVAQLRDTLRRALGRARPPEPAPDLPPA